MAYIIIVVCVVAGDDVASVNQDCSTSVSSGNNRVTKRAYKVLALEQKKVSLFQQKLNKDERNDDPDVCFLKGLLPELKRAERPSTLKRKIMEAIDDYLETERLTYGTK